MALFKHNVLGQLEYKYYPKLELKKKKKSLALWKISAN